ncbi:MAG: hypothetical protein LBM76_02875 [Mycoplasmataceae bacterium]|nr:hypothetical protein [Mycoplasmataceae bacterium]
MANSNYKPLDSNSLKLLIILLAFCLWIPGFVVCLCRKEKMTQEDYNVVRVVLIIVGFIWFIIPGIVALLALPPSHKQ